MGAARVVAAMTGGGGAPAGAPGRVVATGDAAGGGRALPASFFDAEDAADRDPATSRGRRFEELADTTSPPAPLMGPPCRLISFAA